MGWLFFSFFSTARRKIPRTSSSTWSSHSDQVHFPFPSLRLVDLQVEERKEGNVVPSGQSPRRSPNNISFLVIGMLVTARPPFVHLFAWRLHPNTRNQAKGMLEVLRLAHVNSEFESRVSVRPSFRPVGRYVTGRTLSKLRWRPRLKAKDHMLVLALRRGR